MTSEGSYSAITGLLQEVGSDYVIIGTGRDRIYLREGLSVDIPVGTSVTAFVRRVGGRDVAERVDASRIG
jgi:hypothetical protein